MTTMSLRESAAVRQARSRSDFADHRVVIDVMPSPATRARHRQRRLDDIPQQKFGADTKDFRFHI
jgi:hypothetical protein